MTNIPPYRDTPDVLPSRFLNWLEELRSRLRPVVEFHIGDGSPEGVVTAEQAARYYNRTGAAGTFLYVKTTTTGDTGWVAYA